MAEYKEKIMELLGPIIQNKYTILQVYGKSLLKNYSFRIPGHPNGFVSIGIKGKHISIPNTEVVGVIVDIPLIQGLEKVNFESFNDYIPGMSRRLGEANFHWDTREEKEKTLCEAREWAEKKIKDFIEFSKTYNGSKKYSL